jgi:membrane protease YdiL (CAAX protease family)
MAGIVAEFAPMFTAAIVASVLGYTWVLAPIAPRWTSIAAGAIVITLALARAIKSGEWGLAPRAFVPSLRETSVFTAAAGIVVAVAGWRLGSWHARATLWRDVAILIPWALGQQFVLHTVLLRESQAATSRTVGIIVAAALFAALHLPNPFLTATTLVAALAWCWIYDRHPNVLPLAFSHAVLTLLVLYALDDATTGRLRVGVGYLAR